MNEKILIAMFIIALASLFGCTGQEKVVYDCSRCNLTQDCSKCSAGAGIEPIKIKAGLTMLIPPSCTDELCGITKDKGWASELGLDISVYKADWAQGPIILMYTEDKTGILSTSTKKDFMQSVCDFVKNEKACKIAKDEQIAAQGNVKICLQNYSVSMDTIAFYHTSTCPHCAKMKPWVQELESKGYKFLWAQADDPGNANMTILNQCFSTIIGLGEGVPQFACPSNGKRQLGEFPSKGDMESFAKECAASAKQ